MARSFRHSFRAWALPYETATALERPFRPLGGRLRSSRSSPLVSLTGKKQPVVGGAQFAF